MLNYCWTDQCKPNEGKVLPAIKCFTCDVIGADEPDIAKITAENELLVKKIEKLTADLDKIQKNNK